MLRYDPRAELASRDVVVRAMVNEMRAEGTDHVLAGRDASRRRLAARAVPERHRRPGRATGSTWRRSSSRWRRCATTSSAAWSPTSGGARACPASTPAARWPARASTAPTGWPRNSLLEGLVFSDRVVRDLDRYIGRLGEDVRRLRFDLPEAPAGGGGSDAAAARRRLTDVMMREVGVLRRGDDLRRALDELGGAHVRAALRDAGRGRVRDAQPAHPGHADRQVRPAARGVARRASA